MSRSGYGEDCEVTDLNLYRANVERTIQGKRGQAFLRELVEALDAMPEKRLVAHDFVREGASCALGAVALKRQMDAAKITELQEAAQYAAEDEWEQSLPYEMARSFGINHMLAAEIMYLNDEMLVISFGGEPKPDYDAERWRRMRAWALENLKPENREGLE